MKRKQITDRLQTLTDDDLDILLSEEIKRDPTESNSFLILLIKEYKWRICGNK